MMKNYSYLFLMFFLIWATLSKAQSDFKQGYYISNKQDTVHGLIGFRSEIRNSKFCAFKEYETAKTFEFKPGEILGYRFSEGKYYVTRTISHEDGEKKIFLEYVLNGISDLFFYRDGQSKGDHYFIEMKDGKLVELRNDEIRTNINGKEGIKHSKKHIGVLKVAFSDSKEIQPKIEQAELNHKSLISLTKKYHNYVCNGEECIIYEKKQDRLQLKKALFIGLRSSSLTLEDSQDYLSSSYERKVHPSLGLMFDLILPGANKKYSIQFNSEIYNCKFSNFKIQEAYSTIYTEKKINTTNLENAIAFKYNYPKGKFRPNIALGGILSFIIDQKSEQITEFKNPETNENTYTEYLKINIKTPLTGAFAQIGCNYHFTNNWILFGNVKYSGFSSKNTIEPIGENKQITRILKAKYNLISVSIGLYF